MDTRRRRRRRGSQKFLTQQKWTFLKEGMGAKGENSGGGGARVN